MKIKKSSIIIIEAILILAALIWIGVRDCEECGAEMIPLEEAQQIVTDSLGGLQVTGIILSEQHQMYEVLATIGDQQSLFYLSPDGEFLFTQGIDLTRPVGEPVDQNETV